MNLIQHSTLAFVLAASLGFSSLAAANEPAPIAAETNVEQAMSQAITGMRERMREMRRDPEACKMSGTEAKPDSEASPAKPGPRMGMGMMGGMKSGMASDTGMRGEACDMPRGMMGQDKAGMKMQGCRMSGGTMMGCRMMGCGATEKRIDALEKRLDLMQATLEMLLRQHPRP